jgi:signal transduction histidine kinase
MPIDDLFDEEDAIISVATDIVATNSYSDNPLFPHFSKLLLSFVKLNKQQKRIIRLSDKQHLKLSVINREMKHILDNIPVGIAIIDKDGTINPSYSRYMHQLFRDTKKIAGANIDGLLYWEDSRENERGTLRKWLALAFDLIYDWDLVEGLGPDVIQHETDKGPLYYRNSYHRIIHDNGDLFLMIYITDITERIRQKNALKEQETAHNFELEIFSCVVNQENSTDVMDYINDSERMLNESKALFEILPQTEDKMPLYHHMFRLMHSIKGVSRTYGMNEFGRLANMAEDILNKYRSNEISFETGMSDGALASESLGEILQRMKKLLTNAEKILLKIFNQGKENAASVRNRRRGIKIDEQKISSLITMIDALKEKTGHSSEKLRENIDVIADQLFQMTLQPLEVVYNRFHQIVKDIAQSLEKKAELIIDGSPAFLGPEAHYLVINAMIHLLRNSMDHGIESPELRSELGKNPMGTIRIRTAMNKERVYIIISDDGAGIDPQVIAGIAVGKGFVTEEDVALMTDQQKTELILVPGFSSRDSVSDLSGRGVGMDVVAEAMKGLGGTLSIFSELDIGTTLTLEFPVSKREGRSV